jgi:hypothetical protein
MGNELFRKEGIKEGRNGMDNVQWRSCNTNSGRASSTKAFISTIKLNLSWASPAKITKDCSDPGRATAQVGPNVAPPLSIDAEVRAFLLPYKKNIHRK